MKIKRKQQISCYDVTKYIFEQSEKLGFSEKVFRGEITPICLYFCCFRWYNENLRDGWHLEGLNYHQRLKINRSRCFVFRILHFHHFNGFSGCFLLLFFFWHPYKIKDNRSCLFAIPYKVMSWKQNVSIWRKLH